MEEFDWVLYMDSDVFVVRSLLPLVADVLAVSNSSASSKLWAVRDYPAFPDTFNMGMFAMRPSAHEFGDLMCKLHGPCRQIDFAEAWAEQGFINAVYVRNWTELPMTNSMNLHIWSVDREAWKANASHIQLIHFTMVKPWNWFCPWTEYAPMCYLFWNHDDMKFHQIGSQS